MLTRKKQALHIVDPANRASCTTPIRVALADAHRLFREGLRALLELQPDLQVVAEAEDAREVATAVE